MEFELSARIFAHLALACYVAGLLARKDINLRYLILIGTGFYILYYSFVADAPLWDAIIASLFIGLANSVSLVRIYLDRSTRGMGPRARALYAKFPTLNPGQFRRIMKHADWKQAGTDTVLCQNGHIPPALYYFIEGEAIMKRGDQQTPLQDEQFIGELSFIKGPDAVASATVIARPGARYVEWDRAALYQLRARSTSLSNAFGALFNRDMVAKLSTSWPDQRMRRRYPAKF